MLLCFCASTVAGWAIRYFASSFYPVAALLQLGEAAQQHIVLQAATSLRQPYSTPTQLAQTLHIYESRF